MPTRRILKKIPHRFRVGARKTVNLSHAKLTFNQFWLVYQNAHRNPTNRKLHYVGTITALVLLFAALYKQEPNLALIALAQGYAFAWLGHFVFERNSPATFTHPFWSFLCDFRMLFGALLKQKKNIARVGH